MLFLDVYNEIKVFEENINSLAPQSKLLPFLRKIQEIDSAFVNALRCANNPRRIQKLTSDFQAKIRGIVNSQDVGMLFVDLREFRKRLDEVSVPRPLESAWDDLSDSVSQMWKTLNGLARKPENLDLAMKFVGDTAKIFGALEFLEKSGAFLYEISNAVGSETEPDYENGQDVLQIRFAHSNERLDDFACRISALSDMYENTALIVGIGLVDHPPIAAKVESGSLLARIFGESRVLAFIDWFLKNSLRYLYSKYTTEGKICAIPNKIEILEEQWQLYEYLKKILPKERVEKLEGDLAETLLSATCRVALDTQKLIGGMPAAEINGELLALSEENERRYLESWRQALPSGMVAEISAGEGSKGPPADSDQGE